MNKYQILTKSTALFFKYDEAVEYKKLKCGLKKQYKAMTNTSCDALYVIKRIKLFWIPFYAVVIVREDDI